MSDLVHPAVRLDVNGVVLFPGGMMHPYTFRDMMGEDAYQELLARPRVASPYSKENTEDDSCKG